MSADLAAALVSVHKPFAYLVELDWNGTKERFWTGYGNFDWQHPDDDQARVWYGTGAMGKVTLPEESGEVQVSEMTLELTGVDGDAQDENGVALRDRIAEEIRGGEVNIWIAFLGPDYRVEVSQLMRTGVLDRASFDETAELAVIRVHARADFPFLDTQQVLRWTPEEQAAWLTSRGIDPASDTGFDHMHLQRNNDFAWLPG